MTQIDSVDYAEDVFSGVDEAMRKTAWTPEAIKLLVLVGDAPSHDLGHKWNLSGQDENTLRAIADDESLYILALHIKNPRATKYNHRGRRTIQGFVHQPRRRKRLVFHGAQQGPGRLSGCH